ncbi:N-acyl-D-amino-acid deacylase family protein [Aestuariimicrobium ganziense]|uniref:N-acyl-D-amino-acid deacylase family protein n=1 Tax=Aestuariimicrobium ganziense TaxID=2773677 RepID=UPI001943CA3A|nr:amidohydrolase family protein [Aestuariimicrobium ganziense]
MRTLLRGGRLVLPGVDEPTAGDLAFEGGVITAVGEVAGLPGDRVVDVGGRIVVPGLVDAHSHLDAMVFDADAQMACLRQGVTSVVVGQDGVSFAPGSGEYGTDYFGPLNGEHPTYSGGGVAQLLTSYDRTTPVNVAYLVPMGTVRHEVMGMSSAAASCEQLDAMVALVEQGLAEGAVGISTGLDYVPGVHADVPELIRICRAVAALDGVYVTHMRGGYEEKSRLGTTEVGEIVAGSGVRAHISHYHGEPGLLTGLIDELLAEQTAPAVSTRSQGPPLDQPGLVDRVAREERAGVSRSLPRITYDCYLYLRGFTLVAMPLLPPDLLSGARSEVAAKLGNESVRRDLLEVWFPHHAETSALGPGWASQMTIAHAPGRPEVPGLTIAEAAARAGVGEREFVLDLLADTGLHATTVMEPRHTRDVDAMAPLFTHPSMVGGSDGIAIGDHPHPRAFGNFARYLREWVLDRSVWTWGDAAWHLAEHPALVHGFAGGRADQRGRGALRVGMAADIALVDPDTVRDLATYESPRQLAVGIDEVWVNGEQVLRDGTLTGATSGRGLRRA